MTSASNLTKSATIRVIVIEDERELREGLQILLNMTPKISCKKSFGSMEDDLRYLTNAPPDLVLTDIGLPQMDGIEGTRILLEKFPKLQIVVLTVHGEDNKIFQALCAGANGYLLKNTAPSPALSKL